MKKYLYLAAIAIASCGTILSSCSDDKISGDSIFSTKAVQRNAFDEWLYKNYTMPYNIEFQYRLKTEETEQAYNFVPADSAKTVKLAILTKYMWFDAYAETVGLDFIKENAPRIILVTGTPGYTRYRTEVIGSAEGGYKVRLGKVNALTDDQLKDYGSGNWTSIPDKKAQSMGFVSAYSMENPAEDIAELYSIYVTSTPEDWDTIMRNAGNKGGSIINRKLKIIREYMRNAWNVNIELLRTAILRRGGKIGTLNLNTLE